MQPHLAPELGELSNETFESSSRLVIVVGENHASVNGQQALAAMIARLRQKQLLDVVLVEGSEGPIDAERTRQLFSKGGVEQSQLRRQLDAGRLSGYAYASLLDSTLAVHGVESIAAKSEYEAKMMSRGTLETGAMVVRGMAALEKVAARVMPALAPEARKSLETDLAAQRSRVKAFNTACKERAVQLDALVPKYVEMALVQQAMIEIFARLEGDPAYEPFVANQEEARKLSGPLQPIIDKIRRGAAITAEQRANLAPLGAVMKELNEFRTRHSADFAALSQKSERRDQLIKEAEELTKKLPDDSERTLEVQDHFKILANSLRDAAEKHGLSAEESSKFFAIDAKQREAEQLAKSPDELAARDNAMAQLTEKFFVANPARRALLIVGYAHLPGIKRELAKRKISYVAGKLAGAGAEIEPWEHAAWNYRRSNTANWLIRDRLKELSELLNPAWRRQQVEIARYFRETTPAISPDRLVVEGLADGGKIYRRTVKNNGDEPDSVLSIHRRLRPFLPDAEYGEHIVETAPAPREQDGFYQVTDYTIVRRLVKELSGDGIDVAYYHKAKAESDSAPVYRFICPTGEESYRQYVDSTKPDGSRAKSGWRLLIGESDQIEDGGYVFSPMERRLRADAGGGGRGGGIDRKLAPAAPDEGPGSRLVFTINGERGKRHLLALKRQKGGPRTPPLFVTESEIPKLNETLRFTPSRGDYSQMLVLVAHNSAEFRAQVRKASEAKLIEGKQVALITCGDASRETAALREDLLREGALMVWTVDRQITPAAGEKLMRHAREVVDSLPASAGETIDVLMDEALRKWRATAPNDVDLPSFNGAATYVHHQGEPTVRTG